MELAGEVCAFFRREIWSEIWAGTVGNHNTVAERNENMNWEFKSSSEHPRRKGKEILVLEELATSSEMEAINLHLFPSTQTNTRNHNEDNQSDWGRETTVKYAPPSPIYTRCLLPPNAFDVRKERYNRKWRWVLYWLVLLVLPVLLRLSKLALERDTYLIE